MTGYTTDHKPYDQAELSPSSRWREVARSAGGWSRRPRCRRVAADPSAVAVETEPAFDPLRFRIVRCREGGLKVPWRYAAVIRTADRRNPVRCLRFRFRRRLSGRPVVRSRLFHLGGESPYPPRQDGIRPGRTARTDICPGVTNPGEQWLLPGFLTLSHPQRHIFRR